MVAPASVPQMLPTPPTTTVMKLCTMYSEPISDVTFCEQADGDAGNAGDARAEAEGQHVDPVDIDAHRGRHARVLRHGAHLKPQPRAVQNEQQQRQEDSASTKIAIRM
jgi:hypothetical protein